MRLLAGLVALPLLAPGLLVPAHATAFTCQEHEATIVGYPGDVVVGTEGPDVMLVFDGAAGVDAGAGDDILCVNGHVPRVDAGAGNDSVLSSSFRGDHQVTFLGQGEDWFVGGEGDDVVDAGWFSDGTHLDGELDFVSTGPGGAVVRSGDSDPSTRGPNNDAVVLGRADGKTKTVWYAGTMGFGQLKVGPGRTTLRYADTGAQVGSWVVDVPRRSITIDERNRLRWRGHITRFELSAPQATGEPTPLAFLGSADDEVLAWTSGNGVVGEIRMGAGDDRAVLRGSHGSRAYGGAGDDRLTAGEGDDLLRGGQGRDRVDGRGGDDSCYGEVRLRCER
jgi:Ca2+-binding RTX toxin-like protein